MENLKKLFELAKRLREPDGCPWDRDQTIRSLVKCVKDELDEVEEALKKEDDINLAEELGDVLFNIVMMLNVAHETKGIAPEKLAGDTLEKVISRHTWVFGDDKVSDATEALEQWKKNKAKHAKSSESKE